MRTLIEIYDDLKKEFSQKVVITLEDKGCFTYDNGYKLVPSIKVESLDSTGAGDIFHGALAYALAQKWPLRDVTLDSKDEIDEAAALYNALPENLKGTFDAALLKVLEDAKKKYDELTLS